MRSRIAPLLMAATLAIPAIAAAATMAGVNVEEKVAVNGQNLVLNGAGLRKKFFVKVYVGALYLPAKQANAAAILGSDGTRQMVMHFVYSVSKDQMCDAWKEGLEDNTPNASAEVKGEFNTLCTMMEAIPKGNSLVLTYVPGKGTTVDVNGKAKGTLAGKAASDAILATWIGPKPGPGDDFKSAVLGH